MVWLVWQPHKQFKATLFSKLVRMWRQHKRVDDNNGKRLETFSRSSASLGTLNWLNKQFAFRMPRKRPPFWKGWVWVLMCECCVPMPVMLLWLTIALSVKGNMNSVAKQFVVVTSFKREKQFNGNDCKKSPELHFLHPLSSPSLSSFVEFKMAPNCEANAQFGERGEWREGKEEKGRDVAGSNSRHWRRHTVDTEQW
jgi:hypothetical protein